MKKGDFIEVTYTGKLDSGEVFDTTDVEVAKKEGIFNENTTYGPVIACLGEGHLLKGLEEYLEGKEEGKHTIALDAEHAFGKRQGKLLQLVPTQKLVKAGIKPYPGLQLNMDNMLATVKTVSGGRTIIDFNHPLAGRDVSYEVEVKRVVSDDKEKIKGILSLEFRQNASVEEKDGKIVVKGVKKEVQELAKKRVNEIVKKDITFD
tara:strand:- start:1088 stop:1702 length:615 start_codon:yes stop_codon:yes gene_type:complete